MSCMIHDTIYVLLDEAHGCGDSCTVALKLKMVAMSEPASMILSIAKTIITNLLQTLAFDNKYQVLSSYGSISKQVDCKASPTHIIAHFIAILNRVLHFLVRHHDEEMHEKKTRRYKF